MSKNRPVLRMSTVEPEGLLVIGLFSGILIIFLGYLYTSTVQMTFNKTFLVSLSDLPNTVTFLF